MSESAASVVGVHGPVIVAIAKFEQDYIEEWVLYHLALGFERIYLYDNEDTPIYSTILKKYGNKVIHIHIKGNDFSIGVQYVILNHFLTNFAPAHNLKYCLHIDIDEFVALKKHKNIQEFIMEYFQPNIAGISICWRIFGSGGLIKKTNEPVTQRFTRCAPKGHKLMKTLFDVNLVTGYVCSHNLSPKEGNHIIATNGVITTEAENENNDISVIQINHYHNKTLPEFFYQKTRGRVDVPGGLIGKTYYLEPNNNTYDVNLINLYLDKNCNEEEDLTAFNFYNSIQYNIIVSQQTPQEPTSS
jgi:hypothetical protein